jgi:hypothetical protein
MHIGLVGGLDRSEPNYELIARREGHTFEQHRGVMGGRGSRSLQALVERCDVVIIVTAVNSHGAVASARRLARSRPGACLLVDRCGLSRFAQLLKQLGPGGRN